MGHLRAGRSLDKLGQTLQGVLDGKALIVIVSSSRVIVSSSLDDFFNIHVQDHESAHGIPFLGSTVKLHMHHLAQDKACLRWQTHLA